MAASVTVDFNANLARFTGALDKATSDLNKFQSNSQRIGANVGKIFAGLGAGLSVAAFGGFIKSSIDAADSLNDMSKSTGVAVETLAGFKLAAAQSGVELDTVARGIQKFSGVVFDAGNGSKEAAEKLTRLGLSLNTLKGQTPEQQFFALAGALQGVAKDQRPAVLIDLLGQKLAYLAPLLDEGAAGLRKMTDEGKRAYPITQEMAEQADKFNDQMARLKAISGQAGISLAKDLLPSLNDTASAMQRLAQEGHPVLALLRGFAGIGKIPFDLASAAPDFSVQARVKELRKELETLESTAKGGGGVLNKILYGNGKELEQKIEVTKNQIAAFEKFGDKIRPPAAPAKPKEPEAKRIGGLGASGGGGGGTDKRLEFVKSLRREVELLGATDGDKRLFDADRLGITGKALGEVRSLSARLNEYKQSLEAAKIANKEFDESFADNEKHIAEIESLIGAFRKQNEQISAEADLIGATNVERETAVRLRELELVGLSKYSAEWEKAGAAIKKASETSRLSTLIGDSDGSKLKQDREDMVLLAKAFTDGIEQSDGSLKKLSESEYLDTVSKRLGLAKDKVEELDDFAKNAAKNIQDSFADFLFDPFKDGLDGMLQGFGQTIKRIVAEAVAADLAKRLFGDLTKGGEGEGLFGGLLKGVGNLFSGVGGASAGADSASWFDQIFAKGGVMMSPGLSAYSGQIVSKPTVFPFAHGVGLMGEAGPEAILPLQRGADGKLGVAGGGGAGSTINVYVSGNNNAPDVRRAAGQGAREALAALAGAQRYS